MNKTEQETPFSEKIIKFRPHIVYTYIFLSFQPSPTTFKRKALISFLLYISIRVNNKDKDESCKYFEDFVNRIDIVST